MAITMKNKQSKKPRKPVKPRPKPKHRTQQRTKSSKTRGTASGNRANVYRHRNQRIPKGLRLMMMRHNLGRAEGFFTNLGRKYKDVKESVAKRYEDAKQRMGKFYDDNKDTISLGTNIAIAALGAGALGYGTYRLLKQRGDLMG